MIQKNICLRAIRETSGHKDAPEMRLVMAVVAQAVSDYVDYQVRAQWDTLTPTQSKDMCECRRFIIEEAPFTNDGMGQKVMNRINAVNIPEKVAADRRRRLGCVQRDMRRIGEAEAKIEKYERQLSELEAIPGRVQASQREFPYIRASVATEIVNPTRAWQIESKIRTERAYIEQLKRSIKDVTAFVQWCDEPLRGTLRRAFIAGETTAGAEAKALGMTKRSLDNHIIEQAKRYSLLTLRIY